MSEEKREYPRPSLTADIVVVALDEHAALRVLFIRRGQPPFQGHWALPGGFCEPGETVMQAAARELCEETKLTGVHMEELASFTTPGRDPRGWVVSVAHLAMLPAARLAEAQAGDDASETAWLTLGIGADGSFRLAKQDVAIAAEELAFDHREVMAAAVSRMRDQVHRLALALVPSPFSIDEARRAFEAILGAPLDPAAFPAFLVEQGWARAVEVTGAREPRFVAGAAAPRFPWAGKG
ncbi:MAG: NUDIX hydrolase [Byssovorax sp.]